MATTRYAPPSSFWRDCLLIAGILFVLTAICISLFNRMRSVARNDVCLENVSRQSRAMLQYATDYDNHLPPASIWQTAIQTRLSNPLTSCMEILKSPITGLGYAMNSQQDGAQAGTSDQLTLLFESSLLVFDASDNGESFAPRHHTSTSRLKKSWVSFGDGHTKLLSQTEFQTQLQDKAP